MERQIAVAVQSLQSNTTDATNHYKEKQLMQTLKNMDDSYFVTLQGSYNMWQEVLHISFFSTLIAAYIVASCAALTRNCTYVRGCGL